MSGYTPLFDSVLDGTLFGKWPHTGIWTCLLSQVDQHGEVDMNPALLAAKIGIPIDLLLSCIHDFMQPDPGSRTKEHDGRRLELIDPDVRDWGWRVINHTKYREKARLKAKAQREVESGTNAARMSDRRGPPETAADPLSSQLNASQLNADAPRATSAGEMAGELRKLGVTVTSIHPTLLTWVKDGFTTAQLVECVQVARQTKGDHENLAANYLDKILRQPRAQRRQSEPTTTTHEQREGAALQQLAARREAIGLAGFRDPRTNETADQYRKAQDDEWNRRKNAPPPRALTDAIAGALPSFGGRA